MSSEFDLNRRFFTSSTPSAVLGVGDDAALVSVAPDRELAVATDMLVSGTHFFPDADPYMLGRKALAVNLSDMAAMGAKPRWALLALALPQVDGRWLKGFSSGLFALAHEHEVELIGGDTTRGPLSVCIQIMGEVPRSKVAFGIDADLSPVAPGTVRTLVGFPCSGSSMCGNRFRVATSIGG